MNVDINQISDIHGNMGTWHSSYDSYWGAMETMQFDVHLANKQLIALHELLDSFYMMLYSCISKNIFDLPFKRI